MKLYFVYNKTRGRFVARYNGGYGYLRKGDASARITYAKRYPYTRADELVIVERDILPDVE